MKLVMRLFPSTWRIRYGEEFLALLEDQPSGWRRSLDIGRCLLRAHLDHAAPPSVEPTLSGGRRLAVALVILGTGLAGLGFAFFRGASHSAMVRAADVLEPLVMIAPLVLVLALLLAVRRNPDHPLRTLLPTIAADAFLAFSFGLLAVATLRPQLGFFASPTLIELRPFYDLLTATTDAGRESAVAILAGNAFMFTAFGFAYALRRGTPGFLVPLSIATAIAIALEIGQAVLGTGRPSDVTVVVARMLGAALGYAGWRLSWSLPRSGNSVAGI